MVVYHDKRALWEKGMKQAEEWYQAHKNFIEKAVFPVVLLVYPLLFINQGIEVSDTTYSLANFQYFSTTRGTWMVATFLANAVGNLLQHLPGGQLLLGMYFYTALLQGILALMVYFALYRKMQPVLVWFGEMIALGLCWCPSVILYNYLTYFLMTAGILFLYGGICLCGEAEAPEETAQRQKKRQHFCYVAAGVCLGANIAVRMPNMVQAAYILGLWYSVALRCYRKNQKLSDKKGQQAKENRKNAWKQGFQDTLWCMLGYGIGFGIPLLFICMKYGITAYPDMVNTMFAMTEKAADYKPASMLLGMFGDYFRGIQYLAVAIVCMVVGYGFLRLAEWLFPEKPMLQKAARAGYTIALLVLFRFYWGRGVFSFRYYDYTSIYYLSVFFLLGAWLMVGYTLFTGKLAVQEKTLAVLVGLQMLLTPLGSNNALYPIINSMFLVIPFTLQGFGRLLRHEKVSYAWKTFPALLIVLLAVQSVGFHGSFAFQDGVWGEQRDTTIRMPEKVQGVYTNRNNGFLLQELAEYAKEAGLAGQKAIFYGEIPGLGYLLDMPSALGTFWPDLDSYRMTEYERDMEAIRENPPVIILSAQAAAYLSEDADGMNFLEADAEALEEDEKLQILGEFMTQHDYAEMFCNAGYAVYLPKK